MNLSRLLTTATLTAALAATAATVPTGTAHADAPTAKVAKKPYSVTATANRADVVQDGVVVLKGTVKKGATKAKVVLEVKYAGESRWSRTDVTDKLDGAGRFRLVDKIASSRTRAYRVLKPGDAKRRAGRSDVLRVVVYSWRNLTSLQPVRTEETYETRLVKINGTEYPASVYGGGNEGGADYNLDRKCRSLTTRVGLADTSASTATGTATLTTDGTQRYTGSFGLTESAPVSMSVADVFRISFDWTSQNTEGTEEDQSGAYVALGSPQILCRD